jgi:uncharacterized membrane protein (DUF373 family)
VSEHTIVDPPDEPGADVSHKTLFVLERLDTMAHVVVGAFFLILSASVLISSAVMLVQQIYLAVRHQTDDPISDFNYGCVEVLSSLLFAVIILELLRTIITYLQNHDTYAIMKEFLIVGIISSIRKILMIGAESSIIKKENVSDAISANTFVQESIGVVISVMAILLMIGGLILLKRYYGPTESVSKHAAENE